MFYHRLLERLKYNPRIFADIIEFSTSQQANWQPGYDTNGLLWNVEELPLSCQQFPKLVELYDSLRLEFKRPSFFLSKILQGGLVNHVDHRKWCNLGFPLYGDFEQTCIRFHDPFNQVVETLDFSNCQKSEFSPFIINVRMPHSVTVGPHYQNPRVTLMLDLFEWPQHVFSKVDKDCLFDPLPHSLKFYNQ